MTNPESQAASADQGIRVVADTPHGQADDQRIDAWELKAAKRALANLRELLYGQPMRDLLREQIEESDRRLKRYLADSHGEFAMTQVILRATGLKSADFFATVRAALAAVDGAPEQVQEYVIRNVFPMHPEHYTLPPYRGVVETMGGIPTRSRVIPTQDVPAFITQLIDESYPTRLTGAAELDDGTLFTYVLQQLKDTDDGMEANLRIWYPAACPPIYLEEHAEHYAVEFRNGLRMAAAQGHQS
jgi:hypothetical protein